MNLSKDLIIILVIVLLLFGPARLAGLGGALGKTIRDFRKSFRGDDQDDDTKPAPSKSDSITH